VAGGGDKTKIFIFENASAKEVNTRCLTCHAGAPPNFERSAHGHAKVSCTDCHGAHAFKSEANLLKVAQPQLCYSCHTDVKPAFAQPFHHKVDEGLLTCSDCHDPHGTFKGKQLKSMADQNARAARLLRAALRVCRMGLALAPFLLSASALAQDPQPEGTIKDGYTIRQSVDLGGRVVDSSGSGAMYDTLVNLQSGPRILSQTLDVHAVANTSHPFFDDLTESSSGYGGDAYDVTTFAHFQRQALQVPRAFPPRPPVFRLRSAR
jgi:predicted CXXCH cytochrome family protein